MDKIVFADSWQHFFAEQGLKSFEDFFDYRGGKTINRNQKRDVTILTLGGHPGCKRFFMKRFHNPHLKDIVSTWRNFGRPISQAELEWHNANSLLACGVDTYRLVCFGERRKLGLETGSFLVTKELDSTEFVEFVSQRWRELQRAEKEKIMAAIARLIRRIHDVNIVLPDLYVWHFFIRPDKFDDDCYLSIIDLHRMCRNVRSRNTKMKHLGSLHWSMRDKYFDDGLKDLFVDAYMGDNWDGTKAELVKRIRRRIKTMAKRQQPKPY